MKKLIIIIALLVVAVAVGSPYFVGKNTATAVNNLVQQLQEAPGYTAKVKSIETQWFSSAAVIEVSIDPELFEADVNIEDLPFLPLEFNVHVEHGPVLLTSNAGLGWTSYEVSANLEKFRQHINWQPEQALFQISGKTSLVGNSVFTSKILPFTATMPADGSEIDFKGYQGKGNVSNGLLSYTSSLSEVSASSEKGVLVLKGFEADAAADASLDQMLNGKFYSSNGVIKLNAVSFADAAGVSQFEMSDVKMAFETNIDEAAKLGRGVISYHLGGLMFEGFSLADAELVLEMNQLEIKALESFQELSQNMASIAPEKLNESVKTYVDNHLPALLAAEPELNITSLKATLAQGDISANMNSKLVAIEQLPEPLNNPSFWLQHTVANANLQGDQTAIVWLVTQNLKSQFKNNPQTATMNEQELSQAAENQALQLIENFSQQGFILSEGDQYKVAISLKDKALMVNDKPIPLPF